ncbi:hypothetical protein VMUT_1866 [Vulcanisaeta moutnovskia 768-28]|uniref:AAA+ ATPase domain-containing protein n=1 Tax=Vulcanisaeta moutnovskia (strain 768-28) TaxID=985053 RepID=F0QVG5_VULM7|nr:DUF87 domain-containing protein [Vulcanisaeta moutnovskia]ADY02067.1 hypothetical protein VMUT_1866 [Vulcanisaeta moutnovskia 768-28]
MRSKLIIVIIAAVTTYLIDHRVYLIIINTLIPLILIKDLVGFREQVRLFINDGDPIESVRISLAGIMVNGRELVGLRVLGVTYTFDSAFEEALARARALIRLFSKYRIIILVSSSGDYIIGIDKDTYQELFTELERLNIKVVRINGFELANALRLRVRRRSLVRLPLLLLFIPLLITVSAYVFLIFPILYTIYSIGDLSRRKFVINAEFNNEVVRDLRATMVMDSTMIKAEALSFRSRIFHAHASILLVISSNDELRDWVKSTASRVYSKFLMLRHVRYFLSYKDFEVTLRRIQQGEDVYSLYLASTARFDSSFKWRWVPSLPISKVLNANYSRAWSMELNLATLTPFSLQLINEKRGLAIIGKDVNGRDIYWSFSGLSPHTLIIGPTGAGKTTLAMSIAYQVKRRLGSNVRLIIIDPHGHANILNRLISIRIIDLGKSRVVTNELSALIESIRMSNPLLSIGTEGALLRMAGIGGDGISSINELLKRLEELSNNIILKEAYYNLYNALAPIINYYNDFGRNMLLNIHDLLNDDIIFIMKSILSDELLRYLTMLILLSVTRRAVSECRNPPCPLKYLVIIDEAHNVLKLPSEYRVLGVDDPVERMFRELRKFGVALFALMQPPLNVLNEGILGNVGTTVILSGNSQYVSHVASSINGMDNDDTLWLLSGQYRALVLHQGEPRSIRVSQLYVPRELIMKKTNE